MTEKYYKVFWSKDVKKKKKVYNQGVLVLTQNKAKLFGSESEALHDTSAKSIYYHNPDNQEEFILSNVYYISIDVEITKQQFMSGNIFLPSVKRKEKKKIIKTTAEETDGLVLDQNYFIGKYLLEILRPHQLQGVKFMFECITGIRGPEITGCILADYMGLGKTLQTLSLLYILLRHHAQNKFKKAIVVSPLTLVNVWEKQIKKWFSEKMIPVVAKGDGKQISSICKSFSKQCYRLLLISYEPFVANIEILNNHCDVVIFDEGHRLKNHKNQTYKKISNFSCKKRILITGTPLQNSIEEFYTCIKLVNPFLFPSQTLFKNIFQKPILDGMKKNATEQQLKFAFERSKELSNRVKLFSLRRRANVLQKLLPQKKQYHIFFEMTSLQFLWYNRLIEIYKKQNSNQIMSLLNQMRKLFTHPRLFKNYKISQKNLEGITNNFNQSLENQSSNKIQFVLDVIKNSIKSLDKVIVVSYFTETLTIIEDILLTRENISCLRLDGTMNSQKRQRQIQKFQEDPRVTVFLLSAKAGGTGLNLTCANKMIMIEPDWNPSNDHQVMGRIWRDGQIKITHIYRLITISSFQQKILQRQYLKQSLSQKLIDESKNNKLFDLLSMKNLIIKNDNKCLTYSQIENCLDEIKRWNPDFQKQKSDFIKFVYIRKQKNNLAGVNQFDDEQLFLNADDDEATSKQQPQVQYPQLQQQKIIEQQVQFKSEETKNEQKEIQKKQENHKNDKNSKKIIKIQKQNSAERLLNQVKEQFPMVPTGLEILEKIPNLEQQNIVVTHKNGKIELKQNNIMKKLQKKKKNLHFQADQVDTQVSQQ